MTNNDKTRAEFEAWEVFQSLDGTVYRVGTHSHDIKAIAPIKENAEFIVKAANSYYDNQAEIARLRGALERLAFLHQCEQEGLSSGMPSASDWIEAVDNAQQALTESNQPLTTKEKTND